MNQQEKEAKKQDIIKRAEQNPEKAAELLIDAVAWGGSAYSALMALTTTSAAGNFSQEEVDALNKMLENAPLPVSQVGQKLYMNTLMEFMMNGLGLPPQP